MIKGLIGNQGVIVNGGSMSMPYVSTNPNNPMQGMMRINGNDLQAFDGSNWIGVSTSYANVSLDAETHEIIMWAKAQRTMALNRMKLAQENPALMKALEAVKRAEDNFELLSKFVDPNYGYDESIG